MTTRAPIGEFLLEHGALDDDVLRSALAVLTDVHHASLAEVLVELGVVSGDAVERLVRFGIEQLDYEPPLATATLRLLLLEHGLASRAELDEAERVLLERRRTRLGSVLVSMNAIDAGTLAHALEAQRNPASDERNPGSASRPTRGRLAGRPRSHAARPVR